MVWLITVLTLTLLLAWRTGWLRLSNQPLTASVQTQGNRHACVLADAGLGLAQIALPLGWRAASGLNDQAGIQAVAPLRRRYFIVISDPRADFKPGFTIDQHAERTLATLGESVSIVWTNGPQRGQVGTYETLQFEIEGYSDNTAVTYLHTTIAGPRAFHQVVGWATRSAYDRRALEAVLNGFTELPSDHSEPGPLPVSTFRPSSSRYNVH